MPDATIGDIYEVNDFDPRSPDQRRRPEGSRWVFEKTLYGVPEQLESGSTQRVVHLFTLVSEENRIMKVRSIEHTMTPQVLTESQRIVAKVSGGNFTDLRKQTEEEYEIHNVLSSTKCKHILEVYGCSTRRRTHPPSLGYIFMEYAEHGDLDDFLSYLEYNPE